MSFNLFNAMKCCNMIGSYLCNKIEHGNCSFDGKHYGTEITVTYTICNNMNGFVEDEVSYAEVVCYLLLVRQS